MEHRKFHAIHGRAGGVPVAADVYIRYVCPVCGVDNDVESFMLAHMTSEHIERVRGENKIA